MLLWETVVPKKIIPQPIAMVGVKLAKDVVFPDENKGWAPDVSRFSTVE
jgi:hypothetical protein